MIKEKIAHIHLKDAVRKEDGSPEGVVIGDGMLDINGILLKLLEVGYEGFVVQEPHFRIASTLSEDELKLPGGANFSEGGYEATEMSMKRFKEIETQCV